MTSSDYSQSGAAVPLSERTISASGDKASTEGSPPSGAFEGTMFDLLAMTFLNPIQCMNRVAQGTSVSGAVFTSAMMLFALVTVLMIASDVLWKDKALFSLAGGIPFGLMGAFFGALYLSSILSAASHCFAEQTRFRQTLTVVFLSAVPWLLFAPLAFVKSAMGFTGSLMGLIGGLILWGWSVVLFAIGMKAVYQLNIERTIIFLTLPLSMMAVFFMWVSDVFSRMNQILP